MKKPHRVHYNLIYDGGGLSWHKDYRTMLGARIARWWNLHAASWGGTATFGSDVDVAQ